MLRHPRVVFEALLIGIFCVGIFLPGAMLLAGYGTEPTPAEARATILPRTLTADYPVAFYRYFRSRFGLREWLIRRHALLKFKWLGLSSSPEVLVGDQGWLYYWSDGEPDCCAATRPFTQDDLWQWQVTLETRRDWLARHGARFLFVIVPDKHTVYPEHLPRHLRHTNRQSRLDQLVSHLRERSDVEVVDLRQSLLRQKNRCQLYFKLDSHWDQVGAFIADQEIASRLSRWFPRVRPPGWDTVEVTPRRREQHDLLGLLGMHKDDLVEIVPNITPKRKRRARINYGDRQELETGSVIVDLVTSEMPDAEIPRAVILRDSFGMSLVPFLAEHFGHATYLWTTDPTLKQIERERPSVVIWEITERFLMHPVPKPWADAG